MGLLLDLLHFEKQWTKNRLHSLWPLADVVHFNMHLFTYLRERIFKLPLLTWTDTK